MVPSPQLIVALNRTALTAQVLKAGDVAIEVPPFGHREFGPGHDQRCIVDSDARRAGAHEVAGPIFRLHVNGVAGPAEQAQRPQLGPHDRRVRAVSVREYAVAV